MVKRESALLGAAEVHRKNLALLEPPRGLDQTQTFAELEQVRAALLESAFKVPSTLLSHYEYCRQLCAGKPRRGELSINKVTRRYKDKTQEGVRQDVTKLRAEIVSIGKTLAQALLDPQQACFETIERQMGIAARVAVQVPLLKIGAFVRDLQQLLDSPQLPDQNLQFNTLQTKDSLSVKGQRTVAQITKLLEAASTGAIEPQERRLKVAELLLSDGFEAARKIRSTEVCSWLHGIEECASRYLIAGAASTISVGRQTWHSYAAQQVKPLLVRFSALREDCITKNWRLALREAEVYATKQQPTEELQGAAYTGLCEAVDRFESSRGGQFSTFAKRHIRGRVIKEIVTRNLAFPGCYRFLSAFLAATEHLSQDAQCKPTTYELARYLRISEGQVQRLAAAFKPLISLEEWARYPINAGAPKVERVRDLDDSSTDWPLSMYTMRRNTLVAADDDIGDTALDRPIVEEKVRQVLKSLPYRHREILKQRYDLAEQTETPSLQTLGEQFDITSERVRQIQAEGLRKLAQPAHAALLRSFIES